MSDTIWVPKLDDNGPRYRALADAIALAVEAEELNPGDKLPPVRDLAWRIKATPGTVSRAYQLAEHRGVVVAEVGRGTFVRDTGMRSLTATPSIGVSPPTPLLPGDDRQGMIDCRMNRAVDVGQGQIITAALERLIARHGGALPVTDYHRFGADIAEREAAADWLRSGGVPVRPEDLVISAGAQHGILSALTAIGDGGEAIVLTEPLVYPGVKDCARAIGVRLEPVEADAHGVLPDALDAACARYRPSAVLLSLNIQNPSMVTTPLARREAIAEVAQRRRIAIVEDDVYGWLTPERLPSMADIAPERTWYITGLSKCVAAGLRMGYVLTPPGRGEHTARNLHGFAQNVPWLSSALAAELLLSGDAARIKAAVRAETEARAALMREMLGPMARTDPAASRAWLPLPEPWRASDFCAALAAKGVLITPAEIYAVGRSPAPHAVRIGIGNASTRAEVTRGLGLIAETLRARPAPGAVVA